MLFKCINSIPIPNKAVPTIPWSVPSAPTGAKSAAYETAAKKANAYVKPLSNSTGNTQKGFVIIEYRKSLTANAKNIKENTFMLSTRLRIYPENGYNIITCNYICTCCKWI